MAEMYTDDLPSSGLAGKLAVTNKRQEQQIRDLLTQATSLQSQATSLQAQVTALQEGDAVGAHMHPTGDIVGLGSSATLDAPASGDASATEVVKGDDTRLTDDRDPNAHAADHASGGADQVDHDTLQNYDIAQHRVINDSGTSSIELWSADKISSEISAVVQGLDLKDSVETVADTNTTLSGEQTLNGVLTSASRVGVTGQSDATENGIYTTGSGAWIRTADADDNDDVTQGLSFFVASGDKAGFQYVLTTAGPISVGSTGLTFSEVRKLGFGTTAGTAAEGNDTRIPTQDEKDALAGTSTPNGGNPFVNQADFANTQSDVSSLQSDVSTAQSDISTNQGNISTLQSDVSTAQSDISTNQGNISTLQSDVSTAQSDISTNQGNISTNQSDISSLQSVVSTAQSDISNLQSNKLNASDTKIPSQDEKDALAGTGTPSSGDPFVNDSDSRLLQAQNFEIGAKNLSASDDRVIVVCDAATTANIDIDSPSPSDTYDGVTLATFDVLLVHNQADASENGVYIFTDTSTPLSRYVGLNTSAGFAGRKRQFFVREGDTQKGVYISDEPSGFVLDTDDLEFVSIFGSAALENAGTAANEVLKLDGSGKLTAALIDTLLSHPDIRGTATPHIGPFPHLPFNIMDNDGSVFLYAQNKMLFISTEDGEFQVPIGLATQKDDGELDIEVILADGTQVSIGDLDSDDIGMDGRSLRPGYQLPSIGPYGAEKVIQTRGF